LKIPLFIRYKHIDPEYLAQELGRTMLFLTFRVDYITGNLIDVGSYGKVVRPEDILQISKYHKFHRELH